MRTNPELRALAREKLAGHWTSAVLAFLIYGVILGVASSIKGAGWLFSLLLGGPLLLGVAGYCLKLQRGEEVAAEDVLQGFKTYVPALMLHLWTVLLTFLWTLLLVVPGIIAGLNYSQAFYLLRDNPELEARQALRLSTQMMTGHKAQLFLLLLSFLGWALLAALTLGIGFLWLGPYMGVTLAGFHEELRKSHPEALSGPELPA